MSAHSGSALVSGRVGPRASVSSEDTIPVLAAVGVCMLLPSALFALAALITALIMNNLGGSRLGSIEAPVCDDRVTYFLWGCVVLFYLWSLLHLAVLFGPRAWRNATSKLVLCALVAAALALWIVNGHFTLRDYMDDECDGSIYHYLLIADLACLYSYFLCFFLTLVLSSAGACRSVAESAEDIDDRLSQPVLGAEYRPGAGLQKFGRTRRDGARIGSNEQIQRTEDAFGAAYPSPTSHTAPVLLHVGTPSAAAASAVVEGGGFERAFGAAGARPHVSVEAESGALFAERDGQQGGAARAELLEMERYMGGGARPAVSTGGYGHDPNRLYSPVSSAAPPQQRRHDSALDDEGTDGDSARWRISEGGARQRGGATSILPLTPKMH